MRATENLARKLKIDERAIRAAVAVEDGGGDSPDSTDYLCFTAVDGDASVSMVGMNAQGGEVTSAPTIYYSFDKVTWTSWIENNAGAAISLTDGQSVYMYGENPNGVSNATTGDTYTFQMTGKVAASGNIQTLLSQAGDRMDVPANAFLRLFKGCTSLITAPSLPATTLEDYCYSFMFNGCTSLTAAPKLPATILASYCYQSMFNDCTSLTIAPSLPAATLATNCYSNMFYGCKSLKSVTTYCVNWSISSTGNWLANAGKNATNPTIYCPADSTIPEGNNSGIPTGWTRADL